jgi:hypothetical protein
VTQNQLTEKFAEFAIKIKKTHFCLKFLHKLCVAKIPLDYNEVDAFRLCALSGVRWGWSAGALVNSGRVCVNEKVLFGEGGWNSRRLKGRMLMTFFLSLNTRKRCTRAKKNSSPRGGAKKVKKCIREIK